MNRNASSNVRTTERSLDIIETLHELGGARLTDVAAHLDLPDSTVHNHLQTLVCRGYVVNENGLYRVSLRFLELGEHARTRRKLYDVATTEVDGLAAETEESASLLVEENGHGVYLYTAQPRDAVPLNLDPGTHIGLHATALGKVILAHLAESRLDTIIDEHGLPARTENTITDRETLAGELELIREQGYAIDDEEQFRGIRCVAVAVKSEAGQSIGALSVSGPASRLDTDPDGELLDCLLDVKNVVELKLAYA